MKPINMTNFYCKGGKNFHDENGDFDIVGWNKAYINLSKAGKLSNSAMEQLDETKCKQQCFDCMVLVQKRRDKTQSIKKGGAEN